jgi:uncharacterized membrane protein
MLSGPLRAFGVSLIVFYTLGSRATKYGQLRKAQLEDGHHEAGYRSASQVFCNSFAAFIASVAWNCIYVPDSIPSTLLRKIYTVPTFPYRSDKWCPLEISHSRALIFAALGHFACCLGDTLASELGILSHSPPVLITTFKPVPHGTNGGISLGGTLASIGGGTVMGLTLAASLILDNKRCREDWVGVLAPLAAWGTAAGGIGSMVDSLLGATIQRTRYSQERKRILADDHDNDSETDVKIISGVHILNNNQVNLVSSVFTAVILASFA